MIVTPEKVRGAGNDELAARAPRSGFFFNLDVFCNARIRAPFCQPSPPSCCCFAEAISGDVEKNTPSESREQRNGPSGGRGKIMGASRFFRQTPCWSSSAPA